MYIFANFLRSALALPLALLSGAVEPLQTVLRIFDIAACLTLARKRLVAVDSLKIPIHNKLRSVFVRVMCACFGRLIASARSDVKLSWRTDEDDTC